MPGIVGLIARQPRPDLAATLAEMLRAVEREPFHETGSVCEPDLGAAVGWVHHEGMFPGGLPLWNEARDIGLVFWGEIFPGDARGILQRYEREGAAFLESLNGWFCGLILDRRAGRVLLFNDRFGFQRLYWHEDESAFYFSSEAKSLLRVLPPLRRLDPRSLGELVSCGCALQGRSLFAGVSLLPGAARWVFAPGQSPRRETYFQREAWELQTPLSEREFADELRETFARVLPHYLQAPVPVGMSLTGGLDGRMIMAWARRAPGTLPCYTFGGSYRDCGDVRLARRIARHCGQTHQVIPVGAEFLKHFPALARRAIRVSDGAMDLTGAAELHVNRIARGIAPIRVTGNYGSEIVRGGVAFRPHPPQPGLFPPEFARHIEAAAMTYRGESDCHPVSFIAFKQVPWHHYARFSLEQSELRPRSPFLDQALVSLMYRAPRASVASKEPTFRLIAACDPALARLPTDRGLRHPPVPLFTRLAHLWQEFTVRAEYAYDYGMPQRLARFDHALAPLRLERLFLGRHKFCHFRVWYRDQLAGFVKEVLLDPRTLNRPYLLRAAVERIVHFHTNGRGNYTSEIHTLLALELIQRELIESH
jgi:asparagine synthase (glutamine-hydrolysing)